MVENVTAVFLSSLVSKRPAFLFLSSTMVYSFKVSFVQLWVMVKKTKGTKRINIKGFMHEWKSHLSCMTKNHRWGGFFLGAYFVHILVSSYNMTISNFCTYELTLLSNSDSFEDLLYWPSRLLCLIKYGIFNGDSWLL